MPAEVVPSRASAGPVGAAGRRPADAGRAADGRARRPRSCPSAPVRTVGSRPDSASRPESPRSCGPTSTCWSIRGPVVPSTSAGAGATAASGTCARPGTTGQDAGPEPEFPVLDRIRQAESTGREVRVDVLAHGLRGAEATLVERAARDALGLPADRGRSGPTHAGRRAGRPVGQAGQVQAPPPGGPAAGRRHRAPTPPTRRPATGGGSGAGGPTPLAPLAPVGGGGGRRPGGRRPPHRAVGADRPAGGARSAGRGRPLLLRRDRRRGARAALPDRSVAAYFGPGAPSPVTYVWCGPHWVNAPH